MRICAPVTNCRGWAEIEVLLKEESASRNERGSAANCRADGEPKMKTKSLMSFFVLNLGALGCGPSFSSETVAETESSSGTDAGSGDSSAGPESAGVTSDGGGGSTAASSGGSPDDATSSPGGSPDDATSSPGGSSEDSETTDAGADGTASSSGNGPMESTGSTGENDGSSSGSSSPGSTGSTGGTGGSSSSTGASGGSGSSVVVEECGAFGGAALLDLDNGTETWVVELDIASMGTVSDVAVDLHIVAPTFPVPSTFDATTITLRHEGDAVLLYDDQCPAATEIELLFEDGASALDCADISGGGTVEPFGSLATFAGAAAGGTWALEVERPATIINGPPSTVTACVSVTSN